MGDAGSALAEYEQAWAMIQAEARGVATNSPRRSISRMVKALRICDRPEDAISLARDGLDRFPGFTDLVFEQGVRASQRRSPRRRIAHFERCIEMGDAPARYTAVVGCGTYLPRIALAELYLHSGDAEQALELLLRGARSQILSFFGA